MLNKQFDPKFSLGFQATYSGCCCLAYLDSTPYSNLIPLLRLASTHKSKRRFPLELVLDNGECVC